MDCTVMSLLSSTDPPLSMTCPFVYCTQCLFRISTGKQGNVNFSVQDGMNLSSELSGVLGHFLKLNSYRVIESAADPNMGRLFINGKSFQVQYKRHVHDKNCWTISDTDANIMMKQIVNKYH